MKIAILTQPLLRNYGCILQNYALQTVLRRQGHDVKTIDYIYPHTSFIILLLSWTKTLVYYMIGKKTRRFARFQKADSRTPLMNDFVSKNLSLTKIVRNYSKKQFKEYGFDCAVVGSDQVWRPKYNRHLKDMFLYFVKKLSIKRIAYAASFGSEEWEFSQKQTKICSALAQKFDALSVREEDGVALCKKYLDIDATWVLDPTLLLEKDDYLLLCSNVPKTQNKFLIVYLLDVNESVKLFCENEAKKRGLAVRFFTAGSKATLSVPEWLAMFRDAAYVVTDSFHGTVFSIIFKKEFRSFYNEKRGTARFESLLKLYKSGKLDEMRDFSLKWLKNALET